ncbi:MAG: nucleotidyltransferase domain-containing protein [Endomicrobium sp.]|jgi:predicted nucleotidyltransferase|nr:nucleotidyltransferase domain-containing protein [Endomicrobium sp.]
MPDIFIRKTYLNELVSIIKRIYPKSVVWAYGSRVGYDKNNVDESSDLDLTIKEFGQSKHSVVHLKEALRESNIPFLIDVSIFDNLPTNFQKEILKQYIVIYDGKKIV